MRCSARTQIPTLAVKHCLHKTFSWNSNTNACNWSKYVGSYSSSNANRLVRNLRIGSTPCQVNMISTSPHIFGITCCKVNHVSTQHLQSHRSCPWCHKHDLLNSGTRHTWPIRSLAFAGSQANPMSTIHHTAHKLRARRNQHKLA